MVCLYCEGERECGMSKKRERESEREKEAERMAQVESYFNEGTEGRKRPH